MNEYNICVLCNKEYEGIGNNAQPLVEGECCDNCNIKVLKERLKEAGEHPAQEKLK